MGGTSKDALRVISNECACPKFIEGKWIAAEGPPTNMWHVYIIKCSDDSLYTGVTNDLYRRIYQHKNKEIKGFTQNIV